MSNSTNAEILLAGAIAAFSVDLLIYPLDTIKTRFQSQDYAEGYAPSAAGRRPPAFAVRGLYQGVGSVVVATLPAAGLFFTVYESAKSALGTTLPSLPLPLMHCLASGAAELSSCIILTPAEVIKQNAQMLRRSGGTTTTESSSLAALRMIREADGGATRRLWTGYAALAARNLPFTAVQFPVFETVRARIWAWKDSRSSLKWADFASQNRSLTETGVITGVSAAASGAFAAVITTPTDVVKTRMMLSAGGSDSRRTDSHTASGYRVAKQIYRENGVRALFRGGALRSSWSALGSGLYLGTYEVAKVWLQREKRLVDDAP